MSGLDDPIVVIGSGPCGAIAARELVRAGRRVLMLEAGSTLPRGMIVRAAGHTLARRRNDDHLSTDRHVALGDPDTEWNTSISPGGLSNYWTAAVPRYAPEDFTDGARVDERYRWPVSYDDLVPYYEIAEDLLSISGAATSIPMLPAGRTRYAVRLPKDWERLAGAAAHRSLTVLPMARGRRWMVARRGSEFNSYHVIVSPLESSASFELRRGARATRIVLDRAGAVTGVEYLDATSGQTTVVACRAVVVAAGAIDSAALLLRSRSAAAPAGIGNDHALVGTHLHDHPREWWRAQLCTPMTMLDQPAYLVRAPYDELPPLSGASATIGLVRSRDRLKTYCHGTATMFGVQIFGTMEPRPDGVMRMSADRTDATGTPMIELDVRYDDAALRSLAAAKEHFVEQLASVGARVLPEEWRPRPGSSVHYAGAARMHRSREFGVVDEWNRVHGTPSVVVADMACFTTNPEKNPTLTAMALAARAARRLAVDAA
jgi:choline dehydrogenase-like flavoprotein